MHHFFLSYARGDDDEYVRRFFLDLSREIRVLEGLPRGAQVGFMDTDSLRVGGEWVRGLDTALTGCATFIPLYTPGYFRSEWCGREWALFEHLLSLRTDLGCGSGAFVPVVWLMPRALPEAARTLHHSTDAFGTAYARFGLRQLIRLRRHEDDYQEAVSALAREIVDIARRCRERPVVVESLWDVDSAFHRIGTAGAEPVTPAGAGLVEPGTVEPGTIEPGTVELLPLAPPATDARRVHFVIAGAGRDEMRSVRATLDCYGPTPQHWAPYRPELPEPLSSFACEIAAGQELRSEVAGLEDLPERMDRANERNQIVVLLVDAWATRLAGYGEVLLEYDRRNEPTVPVLVALSDHDTETRTCRDALARAVSQAFPNNSLRRDAVFRPDVRTAHQFATDLEQALQVAMNRLMKRGAVLRRPPGPPAPPRAVLQGPDSLANRRTS